MALKNARRPFILETFSYIEEFCSLSKRSAHSPIFPIVPAQLTYSEEGTTFGDVPPVSCLFAPERQKRSGIGANCTLGPAIAAAHLAGTFRNAQNCWHQRHAQRRISQTPKADRIVYPKIPSPQYFAEFAREARGDSAYVFLADAAAQLLHNIRAMVKREVSSSGQNAFLPSLSWRRHNLLAPCRARPEKQVLEAAAEKRNFTVVRGNRSAKGLALDRHLRAE